jgi:DNA-binding NarL/FixJ family response regulator
MSSSSAILICDRDDLFREALVNFLLAAGYSHIEIVATARAALVKMRRERYGYILIGLSRPFSLGRRLAMLAQKLQPEAKVFLLINAADQRDVQNIRCDCIIKEHVAESLLDFLQNKQGEE